MLARYHSFFVQQVRGFFPKVDQADEIGDGSPEIVADNAKEPCFYPVGFVQLRIDLCQLPIGPLAGDALKIDEDPDGHDQQQTGDKRIPESSLAGDFEGVDLVFLIGQGLNIFLFLFFFQQLHLVLLLSQFFQVPVLYAQCQFILVELQQLPCLLG